MRRDVMLRMSANELDRYGRICGIDVTGKATVDEKVTTIEERRGRVAHVEVLGTTLAIPIRRLHDKRVADILDAGTIGDGDAARVMVLLLGEEQYEGVIDLCTDEDGVQDVEAIAHVFATVLGDPELKNY